MATGYMEKRIARMERRILGAEQRVVPDSHVELAKSLYLARMILDSEREADGLLRKLESAGQIESSVAVRIARIAACEAEVLDLEWRCLNAGLTLQDIEDLIPRA